MFEYASTVMDFHWRQKNIFFLALEHVFFCKIITELKKKLGLKMQTKFTMHTNRKKTIRP